MNQYELRWTIKDKLRQKLEETENKKGKKMKDNEQDSGDIQTTSNELRRVAWLAPIMSWPRIMCSQVRMLKFLEPSREMP